MSLFAPDLYRNFLIGFIGGGLILAAGMVEGVDGFAPEIVTRAQAAEADVAIGGAPDIAEEFLIPADGQNAPQ